MTKKFDHWRKQDKKPVTKPVAKAHIEATDGSNVEPGVNIAGSANVSVYKYFVGFMVIVMGFAGYRLTRPVEQKVLVCKHDNVNIKTDATLGSLGPDVRRAEAEKGDGKKQQPKPPPNNGKEKVNDKKPQAKDKKKQDILAGLAGMSGLLWMWRNRKPNPDPDKPPRDPSNGFELIKRFLQWYLAETQVKWEMWRPAEFVRGCVRRGACKICYNHVLSIKSEEMKGLLVSYIVMAPMFAVGTLTSADVAAETVSDKFSSIPTAASPCIPSVHDTTSMSEDGQGVKLGPVYSAKLKQVNSSYCAKAEKVDVDTNNLDQNITAPEAKLTLSDVLCDLLTQLPNSVLKNNPTRTTLSGTELPLEGKWFLHYLSISEIKVLLKYIHANASDISSVLLDTTTEAVVIKSKKENVYLSKAPYLFPYIGGNSALHESLLNLQSTINNPDAKLDPHLEWIDGPPQSNTATQDHKPGASASSTSTRAPDDSSRSNVNSIVSLTAERDAARSELKTTTASLVTTQAELAAEKDNAAKQIAQLTADNLKLHEEETKLHDKITILENKLKAAESAASKCTCGRR